MERGSLQCGSKTASRMYVNRHGTTGGQICDGLEEILTYKDPVMGMGRNLALFIQKVISEVIQSIQSTDIN